MSAQRLQPSGGSSLLFPGRPEGGVFQSRKLRPERMIECCGRYFLTMVRLVKALCGMKMRARACDMSATQARAPGRGAYVAGRLRATFTRDDHDRIYRQHKTVGLPSLRQNVATEETEIVTVDWRNSDLRTERGASYVRTRFCNCRIVWD